MTKCNTVRRNRLTAATGTASLEGRVMLMAATPATTSPTFEGFVRNDVTFEDVIGDRERVLTKEDQAERRREVDRNEIDDRGTRININRSEVEGTTGIGNRSVIADKDLRYHNPLSSSIRGENSSTRWYQRRGNTQIFRVFPGDENWYGSREGSPRSEAFTSRKFDTNVDDGKVLTFSARFQVAEHNNNDGERGTLIFQSKGSGINDDTGSEPGPAVGLKIDKSDNINIVQRSQEEGKKNITTPTGFTVGDSFDFKIEDDGQDYRVYIDGDEKVTGSFERGTSRTVARWGAYVDGGENGILRGDLDSPTIVYVSGAQASLADGDVIVPAGEINDPNRVNEPGNREARA